jgi:hypothetical protein
MTCSRGCCASPREHFLSVSVGAVDRAQMTKTTVDDHGTHKVEITEHFNDRQDVKVKAPRLHINPPTEVRDPE